MKLNFKKMVAAAAAVAVLAGLAFSLQTTTVSAAQNQTISVQNYNPGGNFLAFNLTAATTSAMAGVKSGPGVVMRIIPITVGTGTLTINDLAVNTGAAAANEIDSFPVASFVAGVPITIEAPFKNGLVISAFPTSGLYTVTYN